MRIKLLKDLIRPFILPRAIFQSRHLDGARSEVVRQIEKALRTTISGNMSAGEREWLEGIESLRRSLESSPKEIPVVDYGAGAQFDSRSDLEMYEGLREARKVGEICRSASKPRFWTLLLFCLVREFRPSRCIEMGTSLGISAAYQSAALVLNGKGTLVTLEGAPALADAAGENLSGLGLKNVEVVAGRFQDTLVKVLQENKPVDYLFVDGHHEGKATLKYFEAVLPFLAERALVIFDDISWNRSMRSAWSLIKADERVPAAVDLHQLGIAVFDGTVAEKQVFDIFLI